MTSGEAHQCWPRQASLPIEPGVAERASRVRTAPVGYRGTSRAEPDSAEHRRDPQRHEPRHASLCRVRPPPRSRRVRGWAGRRHRCRFARGSLHTATEEMGKADRLWGSVTTAMRPSHEYVTAARELHAVLTDMTHDGLHAREINEITKNLDIGQALVDVRSTARDVADLARDIQHLPGQLLRCELLFAPASKLTPSVERLQERASGKYVSVLPDEAPDLVTAAVTVAIGSGLAAQALDRAVSPMQQLAVAGLADAAVTGRRSMRTAPPNRAGCGPPPLARCPGPLRGRRCCGQRPSTFMDFDTSRPRHELGRAVGRWPYRNGPILLPLAGRWRAREGVRLSKFRLYESSVICGLSAADHINRIRRNFLT